MIGKICNTLLLVASVIVVLSAPAWGQGKSQPVTLTARVVDAVCFLPGGLKGPSHRECAIGCDKAGVRMYLLDEKADVMYAVMADAPFKDPNAPIRPYLEQVVTVKGDLYTGPGGLKIVAVKEVQAAPQSGATTNPCAAKNPCAPKK